MSYSVSTETKQTILNHFSDEIFRARLHETRSELKSV